MKLLALLAGTSLLVAGVAALVAGELTIALIALIGFLSAASALFAFRGLRRRP